MFGERLRVARQAAGLSQAALATRAGVSRQLVGAAETGHHLPRIDAAVALARALGVTVESLVGPAAAEVSGVVGQVPAAGRPVRVGRVGDQLVCAPLPPLGDGWAAADGIVRGVGVELLPGARPRVVVVGCDPAIGLAGDLLAGGGAPLLAVAASTAAAVDALAGGRTHAVVVHGRERRLPAAPVPVRRAHLARWRVGLAAPADSGVDWWEQALAGRRHVVQREDGAGSQAAFVRAVAEAGGRVPRGPLAGGHLESARWAKLTGQVAVTIEPAAVAGGLAFHALEVHAAELWVAEPWSGHAAVARLMEVLCSAGFQRRLAAVGGYDLDGCGRPVTG